MCIAQKAVSYTVLSVVNAWFLFKLDSIYGCQCFHFQN